MRWLAAAGVMFIEESSDGLGVAEAIVGGKSDERMEFLPDGRIKLFMEKIIPATSKATTAGRRKRLHRELNILVEPHGWKRVHGSVYAKTATT